MKEMTDYRKEIEAFKEFNIKVYVVTSENYFYGGDILEIKEDYFLLDDRKDGKIPITFNSIIKLTKLRDDRNERTNN